MQAMAVSLLPFAALSIDEKKANDLALQKFGGAYGVGAKLLGKMGFGTADGFAGGLGRTGQGIAEPVEPVTTKGEWRGGGYVRVSSTSAPQVGWTRAYSTSHSVD